MTGTERPASMRPFHVLWAGQLVSMIGSDLTFYALIVWTYRQHGSVSSYAILSIVMMLPAVLVAPFAGSFIDRINRKLAIVICDAGAAIGPLAVLALLLSGAAEFWSIYIALLVASAFSSAQRSAYPAAVAQLVPRDKLSQANGLSQLHSSVPEILSPLLGGVLLMSVGLTGVVVIDLITFVVGIAATLAIRLPSLPSLPERTRTRAAPSALLAEFVEATGHVRRTPGLAQLLGLLVLAGFTLAVSRIVFIPYILSFSSEAMMGVYIAVGGAAMIVASLVLSRLAGPRDLVRAIATSIVVFGIGVVLLACRTSHLVFWTGLVALYVGLAMYSSYVATFWQLVIAREMQGRVTSFRIMVSTLASIVAYAITGPLVDRVLTPVFESSAFVAGLPFTAWFIGPGKGVAMGYVTLVSGLVIVGCGVAIGSSGALRKLASVAR